MVWFCFVLVLAVFGRFDLFWYCFSIVLMFLVLEWLQQCDVGSHYCTILRYISENGDSNQYIRYKIEELSALMTSLEFSKNLSFNECVVLGCSFLSITSVKCIDVGRN